MADPLQGAARQPPGDLGVRAGVRLRSDPPGRGSPVPPAQQPAAPEHQPEGDQPPAANVSGNDAPTSPLKGTAESRRHQTSCIFYASFKNIPPSRALHLLNRLQTSFFRVKWIV